MIYSKFTTGITCLFLGGSQQVLLRQLPRPQQDLCGGLRHGRQAVRDSGRRVLRPEQGGHRRQGLRLLDRPRVHYFQ